MSKCFGCGKDFPDRPGGDILLPRCDECKAKPKPPDSYVLKAGVLIPNPEREKYDAEARQARQKTASSPTT